MNAVEIVFKKTIEKRRCTDVDESEFSVGQAAAARSYPRVSVDFALSESSPSLARVPSPALEWRYHTPEQEIACGPAAWLWDYLR